MISLSDFDTVGNTVSIAVGDIDLRAVEIFIQVFHAIVVEIPRGVRSVIRIQAGSGFDIVGNSIRIGVHKLLASHIDRTCRAGYTVNILDEQIFIRSGVDARRTGLQIASGGQHRVGCNIPGPERAPVIRIIIVFGNKSDVAFVHGSGDDGILYRGVSLEINAAAIPAASVRNRHVMKIRLEVVHVQIGIIIDSPVAQQQTVLHRQNIRTFVVIRIVTVGAADRTAIVERVVVQEPGIRDFNLAAGHYDRTGSIAAVAGKQAVVNHRTASSHQIQSSGITTFTAVHGFARGVVSEYRIRYPDRPPLSIDGSGHIGILPIFLIHAFAVLIPHEFAGIVVFKDTVPDIHTGIVQVNRHAVAVFITIANGEAIQPAGHIFLVLQGQETAFALQIDNGLSCAGNAPQLDIVAAEIQLLIAGSGIGAGGDQNHIFPPDAAGGGDCRTDRLFGGGLGQAVIVIIAVCSVNIDDLGETGRIIAQCDLIGIRNSIAVRIGIADRAAIAIFVEIADAVIVTVKNGIIRVIRIQSCRYLHIVGNPVPVRVHKFLTPDIHAISSRAADAVNIRIRRSRCSSGIDAR